MTENKLICPFCDKRLEELYCDGVLLGLRCKNTNCSNKKIMCGNGILWQELITTKEKLLACEECCREWEIDYHLEFEKSTRLENKLDRTRKALDVAVDALKRVRKCHTYTTDEGFVAYEALYKLGEIEQINEITKGGKDD